MLLRKQLEKFPYDKYLFLPICEILLWTEIFACKRKGTHMKDSQLGVENRKETEKF